MGFRFRKSFTILPGLRVNLGKSGVTSVSVGGKGIRVTSGKRGTTVSTSVPGTGVSYSRRLDRTPPRSASSDLPTANQYVRQSAPERIEDYKPYRALAAYAMATPHPQNRSQLSWWRRLLRQDPPKPAVPTDAPDTPSSGWLAGRLEGFQLPIPEVLVEVVQGEGGAIIRLGYDRHLGTPLAWEGQFAERVRDMWLRVVGYRALGELFQAYPALDTVALTAYHNNGTRNFDSALTHYSVLVTRTEWQACFYPASIAPALGDCLNTFGLRVELGVALPLSSHVTPYELVPGSDN